MSARIIFTLIALLLLGGGGYFLGKTFITSGKADLEPIATIEVVTQDIAQSVTVVGEVEPSLFTDLKSEVSGRIERVHVVPGDRVKKDKILVELDKSELETQIEEAALDIEASRLALEKTKLDYDSKKDLSGKGFVSEREFQEADIDHSLAQNQLDIKKSRFQLLQDKLEKTTIRAPHDGVVLGDELTEGMVITGASSVSSGDVLMQIAQLSELIVETEVSEVDVGHVHRDMNVSLSFDSLPEVELAGEIVFISPSARPKANLSSSSGNARVFPITVAFTTENVRVRPGMTAQVHIVLATVEDVLAAELPSLFVEDGESVVYVQDGEAFARRVVDIGINDHSFVEIKSGIKKGDRLATSRPEEFDPKKLEKQPARSKRT